MVSLLIADSTAGFLSAEHLVDKGRGAADARFDGHRPSRAVALAGAALDAGVAPGDPDLPVEALKHLAGAHGKADAAAIAQLRYVGQRDNVFEIDHGSHLLSFYLPKRVMIHRRRPAPVPPISRGRAKRISLLTPESEVNVEEPVKFIAR